MQQPTVIHKLPLLITRGLTYPVTEGSRPLCVQVQGGAPKVWVLMEADGVPAELELRVVGTGQTFFSDEYTYLGTYQEYSGEFVWHVFYKIRTIR